jgi:hypothetical protein
MPRPATSQIIIGWIFFVLFGALAVAASIDGSVGLGVVFVVGAVIAAPVGHLQVLHRYASRRSEADEPPNRHETPLPL